MLLWSLQPELLFEKLQKEQIIRCNPAQSELVTEFGFGPSYDWLAEQMALRVGPPPEGVKYPIWAWHTLDWRHKKPDLRRAECRNYTGNQVCIELEIPDKDVLLSNEDMWYIVLNNGYYGDYSDYYDDSDYEREEKWFDNLPPDEQIRVKRKSWERIFDVTPPRENEWDSHGKYVQATFWELRMDQVIEARHFKGRLAEMPREQTMRQIAAH
ncbi:MAG: DUF3841 domain-containing protein [Prevotellaceae bacterium]|jgi:hypothetical protein|nr:DUF3841 domain-containing protein [Prevotellaceae bacterium]